MKFNLNLQTLKRALFAFCVTLLMILLLIFNVCSSLDSRLNDLLYQHAKNINTDIIIVAIDEESLNELGKYETWTRDYYAKVIENLNQANNKPAVIGVDVIFNGKSNEMSDQALVDVCSGQDNIVLGSKFVFTDTLINQSYVESVATLTTPYDALNQVVTTGFTNAVNDSDNYVRKTIINLQKNDYDEDSFALAVYKKYASFNGLEVPQLKSNKEYYFDFYSKPGEDYQVLSFSDVYKGINIPSYLSGTIVLIGAYDSGFQDDYFVPVSNGTKMNGVEIHANIIESLTNDTFYSDINTIWIYLTYIIFIFGVVFFLYNKNLKLSSLVIASSLVVVFLFSFILRKCGIVYPISLAFMMLILFYLYKIISEYVLSKKEKMKIVKAFKQYVPPEIVETMAKDPSYNNTLGGIKKHIGCLFIDIRGFTKLSEELSPERIVSILNQYLGMVTEQVFKNEGMLDKYVGDAVMAVFNAPYDLEDYAYKACKTAVDIITEGKKIQKAVYDEIGKELKYGIGVHIGDAIIGNIGCDFRMDFTAIGDTVNTAARLEGSAKGDQILISDTLYEAIKDRFECQCVGPYSFKNKANPIICYEIKGLKESLLKEDKKDE